ncbi:putative fungal specific transcription factor [Lyophyllum shimeji]|uniref:Fungal specific transcription factor n=1 Tax=Lyophyllum shimeji TaxID=47721 RepID=A0A9P3US24_LYOSH|nr:putative fungal specific transcription factor [Lyophyllum shimeji]
MSSNRTHKGDESLSPRKLGLSCAECRRSKLKCDRTFPCQSCIRRGCPGICPDGTLAATKGNKVLMAQAQRLSEQVKSLNSRIRELEAALAQSRRAGDEADRRASSSDISNDESIKAVSEAIGSLSLGLDGQAKYHGESAGSEYLQDLLPQEEIQPTKRTEIELPDEILSLMHAFPFGLKDCPYNKSLFIRYLPSRQRAVDLACIYYKRVAWMYDPISSAEFSTSILEPIYGTNEYPATNALHSHKLAVFFMILANGTLYDAHPSATTLAEQYYALARAALSLDSVLLEVTCATVQALFLVFRFVYDASQADKEERWLLTGLTTRIAHTIGLQRDSAAWDLEADEVQRRRRLFWELFTWENWSSLVHGRPGTLFIQHTDCQFPKDLEPFVDASGDRELGFHAWKFRYSAQCLSASMEHLFSTTAPPYSALLSIDKVIRNCAIPKHLRCPDGQSDSAYSWSTEPARALQQYCALCVRDSNLLYIHRSYFSQAVQQAPDDPLRHRYQFSVLTAYQTSCRLISTLRSLYPVCPLAGHVWFFWSAVFSSCTVLAGLVVHSPGCRLAKEAMRGLETAVPFFEEGSKLCRPPSVLSSLQRFHKRASASYTAFKSGQERNASINPGSPDEPDELEVVGGRKAVITTKSNPNSPSLLAPGSPSTLNQDAATASSPASQTTAHEVSAGYYPAMNAPENPMLRNGHYRMEDGVPSFEDHAYSSIGKAMHHPVSDAVNTPLHPGPYMATHTPMLVPSAAHSAHASHDQAAPRAEDKVPNAWHTSYPLPQHPYSQQVSGEFVPYGHPVYPSLLGNIDFGYQPRTVHQQNQEEIWRNFMQGFGP